MYQMAPLFTALLVLLSNLVLSASAACPQIDFRCFRNPDTHPFDCVYCAVNLTTLTPLTQCDTEHLLYAISMVPHHGSDLSISFSSNTPCMDSNHSDKPGNSACKVEIPGLISLLFPNNASLFRCKTVQENDDPSPLCEDYEVLDVPPSPPHGCQSVPPPETPSYDILVHYEVPGKCADCISDGRQCEILSRRNFNREKGRNKLRLILGIGLAIPGSLALLLALVAFWRRRKCSCGSETLESRPTSFEPTKSDLELGNVFFGVPIFSYSVLEEATNNFDPARELGDGGFGVVYKGKLRDGREVAVKRLYEKNYRQVQQFINEVQILTCLRHPNLVALYGCTSRHSRELLLVYEYVSNGTVADHLYGDRAKSALLPWPVRLSIATETASALSYLHASDIIHRDVKTNNILLDHNFCVKVADFGLSRLFPNAVTHISTAPQGTPGYLDPEYHRCFQLTDKSDVYSFGVVLIQLISSLRAIDICRDYHDINLSHYAMNKIQQGALRDLVDPNLGFDSNSGVMMMITSVAELAFQCLQQEGELRPTMDEVLKTLKGIDSTDQEASETQKMDKHDETSHGPEKDDVGLLKSVEQPQAPPNSVMQNCLRRSATSSNS